MNTLSVKGPAEMLAALDAEARGHNITRLDLVREILDEAPWRRRAAQGPSAVDPAGDLIGCVRGGLPDLATNPRHLEEAILEDAERGRRNR